MGPYLRGKYLDDRLRRSPAEAGDNHVRCPRVADGLTSAIWSPSLTIPDRCRIRLSINHSEILIE